MADYETTRRILTLIREVEAGHRLSVPLIQRRFGKMARSCAEKYLEFVRDHCRLVEVKVGREKHWHRPEGPVDASFHDALPIEFGRSALQSLTGTEVHKGLTALAESLQGRVPDEDYQRLQVMSQVYGRLLKPEVPKERAAQLDRLLQAILERQRCEITYQDSLDPPRSRAIEPWRLFESKDVVYVFARCHPEGTVRLFDVDGIKAVALRTDTFRPPIPLPDPAAIQAHACGVFMSDLPVERVVLLAQGWPAERLRRRPLHTAQTHVEVRPGLLRIEVDLQPTDELVGLLLGYLPFVRPLAPARLVERFDERRGDDLPSE